MRQLFLSKRKVRVRTAEEVREVSSSKLMMIFPSSTVLLVVNRSSSIPPLKILAGVVIETKNRADENEEAFSSLRDDCPHSCCYFIAKCFVAVFFKASLQKHLMMLSSRSSAVASTSSTSLRCSKAKTRRRAVVNNIGSFVGANDGRRRPLSAVESSSSSDEKFVPIDYESQNAPGETANGRFGPDAILLIGFTPTERTTVREMLNDMGADFIDLITCTKEMYETMSLRECMGVTQQEEDEKVFSVAGVQTKIVIMSGMIGAEVASVVDAFYESQFKDNAPAFACAVPNSWEKPIKQTAEEISGDHAEATKQRSA